MSESTSIAVTTVLSILVIVDIVGNSLVCAIIKRNRDMRSPMNYLLLNLAVADILYATFIAPKILLKFIVNHPQKLNGTVLCRLLTKGNIAWIGAASSIVTLAAVAIERYYAVMYPHGTKGRLTKRKLKVIIPGVWIFSLILNIPPFLVWNFDEKSKKCLYSWPEKWMLMAYNVTWNIAISLPMLLMAVLYSRIVYTLWLKKNNDNQLNHRQKGVLRVRKRVTLMVVTVSVIFGICWGTDLVVYTMMFSASSYIGYVPIAIANTMVLFNSAVNPFVYALLNQQFRKKMKRMLYRIFSAQIANNTIHPPSPHSVTTLGVVQSGVC